MKLIKATGWLLAAGLLVILLYVYEYVREYIKPYPRMRYPK